jgi:hypothetical protein
MQLFRTPIEIPVSEFNLTYKKNITMIGSCFTDNIGKKLTHYKFPVSINPFGVLYNPESVRNALDILVNEKYFGEEDLHEHNSRWLSLYHDTSFSGHDREMVLQEINKSIHAGNQWLNKTNLLIITFGTARVYHHKKRDHIVSNCHKLPAKEFRRYLLDINDIVEGYRELIGQLKKFNPNLHIVFTISPVRHWKDGAVGNQQSKAILILAIQKLLGEFSEVEYFPAYEILMDELRDYRFYAEDMLHPGTTGINYIWDRFCKTYIKKSTWKLMEKVDAIVKAKNHRPFHPKSLEYQEFLKKQIEKTEQFLDKYPHIDLRPELDYFIAQLEGIEK